MARGGPRTASLEMGEFECECRTISGSLYRTVQSQAKTEPSSHRASVRDINGPMGKPGSVLPSQRRVTCTWHAFTQQMAFLLFFLFLLCVSRGCPFYLDNVQTPPPDSHPAHISIFSLLVRVGNFTFWQENWFYFTSVKNSR